MGTARCVGGGFIFAYPHSGVPLTMGIFRRFTSGERIMIRVITRFRGRCGETTIEEDRRGRLAGGDVRRRHALSGSVVVPTIVIRYIVPPL